MNKFIKYILVTLLVLGTLLFTGWKVFNYYWRTQSTVNTFSDFTEHKFIESAEIIWDEATYDSFQTPINAFFVEVKLNGIDNSFYMQFDTGTPQTLLYGKTINTLKEKYSSLKLYQSESGNTWLKNADIKIGSAKYKAEKILVKTNLGTESLDSDFTIIGTIGYDAILNKKLILDFKKNKLTVTAKELNDMEYSFTILEGASLDRFPILIPAKVDGKSVQLQYDTGSSMFPLILDNKRLLSIKNAGETESLCCITHWGNASEFYRRRLNSEIKIGRLTEFNPYIYGSPSMEQFSYFPNWLMMGITGNQLFIDSVLLLDTKNNQFGISN